jgi:hypothetical protein
MWCGLWIGLTMSTLTAWCEDFRIETQVYTGRQDKLVSENLTLFSDRIVYDFLFDQNDSTRTSEIVIYDLDKNRFVLLDVERELKLEIQQADLTQLLTSLKTSEPWRDQYPFLLEPAFDVKYDEPLQRLELTSKHISYSLKVEPPAKSLAYPAYGQFMDAYAQLNATDPQKLPPFARLELNRELKSRRLIPSEVEMTMDFPNEGSGSLRITATSKHSIIWQLSKSDRERIETANRFWTRYRQVGLAEYRRLNLETADRRSE